jgi:hypothetical protein
MYDKQWVSTIAVGQSILGTSPQQRETNRSSVLQPRKEGQSPRKLLGLTSPIFNKADPLQSRV